MTDRELKNIPANAVGKFRRSTPLLPTVWMTGVLVWATVIGLFLRVPNWAGIFLCSLTGFSFLLYLISYLYLMVNDPAALRREKYSLKELRERESVLPINAGKDRASLPPGYDAAILSRERKSQDPAGNKV